MSGQGHGPAESKAHALANEPGATGRAAEPQANEPGAEAFTVVVAEALPPDTSRARRWAGQLGLSVGPIVLALLASAVLLALMDRDAVAFYGDILTGGVLRASGLQDSIIRMAPVLLIGAGLVVSFRASLWNLGADGQYLLAVALIAGTGPALVAGMPTPLAWLTLAAIAIVVGATWTIVPAFLKARYGLNEIVTTLMMSFIGVGLANLLVKGPFKGPHMVPQTSVLPTEAMLTVIPGTRIHIGVVVAIGVVMAMHLLLTRTSFGTRLDVLGANPRAAVHLGIDVPRLIVLAFLLSGGLIGLAAAADILGVFGYMRADWDPAYGLKVIPLVFLARLNVLAIIPLAAFFGVLSIGGDYATRRADLPSDFVLLFVGLILLFMVVTQYFSERHARGQPLLPTRRRARPAPAVSADA